jgi:L-alanine-DL-glutamate epimerase-like enolase superfamily enzyme
MLPPLLARAISTLRALGLKGASDIFVAEMKNEAEGDSGRELRPSAADWDSSDPVLHVIARSLFAAHEEAVARFEERPLLAGSVCNHMMVESAHALSVYDVLQARREGFPAIKVKIGNSPKTNPEASPEVLEDEARALSRLNGHWGDLELRLDGNERCSRVQMLRFLDRLPLRLRERIEFIEDPFPFSMAEWKSFASETGVRIAFDRGIQGFDEASANGAFDDRSETSLLEEVFAEGAAHVLIYKPAWQSAHQALMAKRLGVPVVVTSVLGHIVGNIWAASQANRLSPDLVHGCFSHAAYREDESVITLKKSKLVRGSRLFGNGPGLGLEPGGIPSHGLHVRWFQRLKWESVL